jgi:hypothetical protein
MGPSPSVQEGRALYHKSAVANIGASGLIRQRFLATSRAMTVARILEQERKTTQSGKANTGKWILEFERKQGQRPDPLTGWNGSGDTNTQVRIAFASKEAAIAYCERHGLAYHVVPAPPVRLKIQAYADNFR